MLIDRDIMVVIIPCSLLPAACDLLPVESRDDGIGLIFDSSITVIKKIPLENFVL